MNRPLRHALLALTLPFALVSIDGCSASAGGGASVMDVEPAPAGSNVTPEDMDYPGHYPKVTVAELGEVVDGGRPGPESVPPRLRSGERPPKLSPCSADAAVRP